MTDSVTGSAARRDPRWPDCCASVGTCKVTDPSVCMYVNHKRRRDRIWAALPKCSVCGGGRLATRHVASFHPEHHKFTTEAVA